MGLIWDGLLVHINVENMGCRPLSQVTKSVRLDDVGTLCLCAVLHLAKDCKVVAQWMQHPQPPYSHGEGSSTRWGSMHQIWERRLSPLLLLTYPALAAENHRLSHTFPC
jgi:hypothetical protein